MRRPHTAASASTLRGAGKGLALGLFAGAIAGTLTAFSDFGAQWLWLEGWRDRGTLLLQLAGLQAPAGAVLGAIVGAAFGAARTRAQRVAALTLFAAPWLAWVGILLFTGGSASRVPWRPVWQMLAAAVLLVSFAATTLVALRLLERASERRALAPWIALGFVLAAVTLDKLDQHVLPNLYLYLHGALATGSWLAYAAAVVAAASPFPGAPTQRATAIAATLGALVLGAGAGSTLYALDANQNVRVALHGPRATHSASLVRALGPLLVEPRQRHELARKVQARRAEKRRATTPGAGPVLQDAHVLLITVDALRADHLGIHGYSRPTSPALDALAARAVLFERAYTQAPHSSYALSSLHASEYLHETLELGHPAPEHTLASTLAAAGYHTAAFYTSGIFHTEAKGLERYERDAFGFERYDRSDHPAEAMTDQALAEVDRVIARGEPNSLLWVHYFDVHEPYLPTTFGTSDLDRYDGEIKAVDAAVARLVREARKLLSRDVIVAFTADHGEEFREHGGVYHGSSLYEEQVHVPFWIDVPGIAPRRIAAPVEHVDLAPTLLALVGAPIPETMRGDDLRGALAGTASPSEPAFSAVIHKRMIVRWPHKLVADLRFGLYELYDLVRDPNERTNLADAEPALRARLTDEIYAWLDDLRVTDAPVADARQSALDRGRLADRRATGPLAALVEDEAASPEMRIDAARLLTKLADPAATAGLLAAMRSRDTRVAAEAAIALGRMFDVRAREPLRTLVATEDPDLRSRAAVSLGRLRDPAAVPGLIDALWVAPELYEREEAVRWLGRLRDARALEPLISLLPELRTRALVAIAMGHIGDPRAYEPLVDVLSWDHHSNVRDAVVRGLGLLGDPRAIEVVLPLAIDEPTLNHASESLVRLGALESGAIGGVDLARAGDGHQGLTRCKSGPLLHDWDYLHRTQCETRGGQASLQLGVPRDVAGAPGGVVAVLGVRRIDGQTPTELRVMLGDDVLAPAQVDGSWAEIRWELPPGRLTTAVVHAELRSNDPKARLALDHLLLIPKPTLLVAATGG